MKKFFDKQTLFIIGTLVIGFLLNQRNCTPDPYCDSDPVYGGCSSVCESGTASQLFTKSLGISLFSNFELFSLI